MKITEVYPEETQSARWGVEHNGKRYEIVLSKMDTAQMTEDERHKASGILRVGDEGFFTYQLTNFGIAMSAEPTLFALAIQRFDRVLESRLRENE